MHITLVQTTTTPAQPLLWIDTEARTLNDAQTVQPYGDDENIEDVADQQRIAQDWVSSFSDDEIAEMEIVVG